MPDELQRGASGELCSWKQVAAYLGVSVRTAQVLERQRGLPVRRLAGTRGRISCSVEELHNWKNAAINQKSNLEENRPSPRKRYSRRLVIGLAGALLTGSVIAVGIMRSLLLPGKPTSYSVETNALVVTDAHGRECWRHVFPQGLNHAVYAGENSTRYAWIGDLTGNGEQEVLFVPAATAPEEQTHNSLVCFGQHGVERFLVGKIRKNGPNRIVVASGHNPYWPCQIATLDADGRLVREYWHSGHLKDLQLADLDGDGNNEVYAAGISNAHKTTTLLILDPETLTGASIEPPEYQLLGFGLPAERARVLLPRSCLNEAIDPYNSIRNLTVDKDGVRVQTLELVGDAAGVIHHFSKDLREYHAVLADSYRIAYKRLHNNRTLPASCTLDQVLKPTDLATTRTNNQERVKTNSSVTVHQ